MRYTLHKKVETFMKGYPEDGSESTEYKTTFHLVKDTQEAEEEWGEYVADESGNQDYSYRISFKKIGVYWSHELEELKKEIEKVLKDEKSKVRKKTD